MKCDSREVCSTCTIYLWKPRIEPKHYMYCPQCKHDILCDRGIIQEFIYDKDKIPVGVRHLCIICRTEVEDRTWPNDELNDDTYIKLTE